MEFAMQTHQFNDGAARPANSSVLSLWITPLVFVLTAVLSTLPAGAQEASFVHRLGNDTIAIEQFTRTANRLVGEVVSRQGAAVTRLQYEVTLAADGRPTAVTYRPRNAAGAALPNQPNEVRLTFVGDSVKREAVFADSVSTRMLPAARATPIANPAYALYEVAFAQMRRANAQNATFATVGTGAGTPGSLTLVAGAGDTIRLSNVAGTTVFLADRQGRLLGLDGTNSTQKLISTRGTTRFDIAALAARFAPTGTLSARGVAHGSFMQSVVFVSYGRPQVRGRTVWGGTLVPFDAVWRTGANEATHLATSRELTFGNVIVPPGLYTLWIDNARGGPQLAINRQVGQWGAGANIYDAAKDLGRVPLTMAATPEHVEEFTINIRNTGQGRGAIEFAWGAQMATAAFTVR
jgi:hypothetical protein